MKIGWPTLWLDERCLRLHISGTKRARRSRAAVVKYIEDNPGCTTEEVGDAMLESRAYRPRPNARHLRKGADDWARRHTIALLRLGYIATQGSHPVCYFFREQAPIVSCAKTGHSITQEPGHSHEHQEDEEWMGH